MNALHIHQLLDNMMLKEDTVTADDLSRDLTDTSSYTGTVGLCHSDLSHGSLSLLVELRHTEAHLYHRENIGQSTLKLLLNDLEGGDLFSELLSLQRVLHGRLNRSGSNTCSQPGDKDTRMLQDVVGT